MPVETPSPYRSAAKAREQAREQARRDAAKPTKPKPTFRENVRFWVITIAVVLFVRAFLFEPYRIPSESMEDTLLVGDFLIVSKLHYGARTPNTLAVPFVGWYLPGFELPQTRLPGFSAPQRGDVVVFNYPASRDVERGVIPASVPVERRAPYIKRLVALPGDTVAVRDKVVYLNGESQALRPTQKQRWRVTMDSLAAPISAEALEALGIRAVLPVSSLPGTPAEFGVDATPAAARALAAREGVAAVTPAFYPAGAIVSDLRFPPGGTTNADQWGPVVVPRAGVTVPLNARTWPGLQEVITRYEGHTADATADGFEVDGEPATSYTFAQDYYLVMGDNRDNSVDGRFWGFVPANHLVGRAVLTFISIDTGGTWLPRFSRFFRPIR